MLSQIVQDALNDQINNEFSSSYAYLAMAAHCEQQNFPGFAKWLTLQSREEYGHGMKLYNFMVARNCRVVLKQIPAPKGGWDNVASVFSDVLAQEMEVSSRINALYELAFKEKAFPELVELQWFITEQVEEERTAREVLAKLQLVEGDPAALLDLDRELGARERAEDQTQGA